MNRVLFVMFLFGSTSAVAQYGQTWRPTNRSGGDDINYLNPREYVIAGVTVSGTQFLDKDALITISKLTKGERIVVPGEVIANTIKNLWSQNLLDDVQLNITAINGDSIYFDIAVVERARLTRIDITGVRKHQLEDIRSKLDGKKGKIVNENLRSTVSNVIKKYFHEKGYLNTAVNISEANDSTTLNHVILKVDVNTHRRTIVNRIIFEGNQKFTEAQLRGFLKKTKQRAFYRIFGPGKFIRDKYEESKRILIEKMQERGYRDAEIVEDTVKRHNDKMVDIYIKLYEGPVYFFGNIIWSGHTKYSTKALNEVLRIEKGHVFSDQKLNSGLHGNPNGNDISSLYMNDGYLTFNVDPVQTKIRGDTIDLELRMYEGPQYTINKIVIKGNELTNDRVILREIRTMPGQKFSKEAIIRSVREIAQLGNFDDQKTEPKPVNINPKDGTVDIEYHVVEKASDQVELSGGVGGGRVIGTLGLTFNNFSMRNFFNGKLWRPVPKGDGQKLSIRAQTNAKRYQSYNLSFSEPWFGGKKPIRFGFNLFTSLYSNGLDSDDDLKRIRQNGMTLNLGQRLKFPDDYFEASTGISLQQYVLNNYVDFLLANGTAYNLNLSQNIGRNSIDSPIYPTSGSNLQVTLQMTPPYSLLNNINYSTASEQEKYRFVEYYKLKFESQWFERVYGKLVLKMQAQFGFLGYYNIDLGPSPFERFKLGGDGMQGFDFLQATEVVPMRGYPNNSVVQTKSGSTISERSGSPVFSKYVLELRHPITLNQQVSVFAMAFLEAGSTWNTIKEFTPFDVKRSAGLGLRIFLPILGTFGINYSYGFDEIYEGNVLKKSGWQFQFTIGQSYNNQFN